MSKNRRIWRVLAVGGVLALALAVSVGAVWAQGAGMGRMGRGMGPGPGMMGQRMMGAGMMGMGPGGPGGRLGRMGGILGLRQLGALGLTDEQRQEIRTVMQSHQAEFRAHAQKAQPVHQQLREAVMANNTAAIDALAAELGQLAAEGAKLRARAHADVFAKLTPEQQAKAKELRDQAEARMKLFRQNPNR